MSLEQLGIKKLSDRGLALTPELEADSFAKVIPFGISFLDKMLYGISPEDLVMIGAATGVGKSELVNWMAIHAASNGKKVVVFALEAYVGEWESRIKYRLYMQCLVETHGPIILARFTYLDFKYGRMRSMLEPHKDRVNQLLKALDNISVFYRGRDFGIREFERIFTAVNDKADLVIVDHLHYFDSTDENENRAMTAIMKKIKDLNQITKIPVVVVGHLRKSFNAREKPLCPGEQEFHGTSNLIKISTIAITIAPGEQLEGSTHRYQTYFRIVKARSDGAATRYCGLGVFDTRLNTYENNFVIGKLTKNETEFEQLTQQQIPAWFKER